MHYLWLSLRWICLQDALRKTSIISFWKDVMSSDGPVGTKKSAKIDIHKNWRQIYFFSFLRIEMDELADFRGAVETALRRRGFEKSLKNEQIVQEIVRICSKYKITVEKLLFKHDLLWMKNLVPDALNLDVLDKLDAQLQQETTQNSCKENEFSSSNLQGSSSAQKQFVFNLDDLFEGNLLNREAPLNANCQRDAVSREDSACVQLDSPPFSPVRGIFNKQARAPQRATESEFLLEGDLDVNVLPSETRSSGEVLDEYIGEGYQQLAQNGSIHRMERINLAYETKETFFYACNETENANQIYEQYVETMCKALISKIQKTPSESVQWPASWDYLPASEEKHLVAGYIRRVDWIPKGVQVVVDDTHSHLFTVNISSLGSCSLFPGAVVVFEGTKCQDGSFQAERVFNITYLKSDSNKSYNSMMKHPMQTIVKEIQVIIASGPYTISTNLRYDPLKRLLEKVEEMKPDLVILIGPFLDESHRLVENGPAEVTYEEIIAKRVGRLLSSCFSKISTKCVIIPHLNDVFHHFTFPQRAFDHSVFFPDEKPDNVIFLDNPAVFRFGHIDISATSVPVLDDLSAVAYIKTPNQKGRIAALCEVLVDEESFYPIFPPVQERPLDYSNVQRLKWDTKKTKLVILISSLKPFTQKLKGNILCVNPGRLSKGVNNGSFALINTCFQDFSGDGKDSEEVDFCNFTRVKIIRS